MTRFGGTRIDWAEASLRAFFAWAHHKSIIAPNPDAALHHLQLLEIAPQRVLPHA